MFVGCSSVTASHFHCSALIAKLNDLSECWFVAKQTQRCFVRQHHFVFSIRAVLASPSFSLKLKNEKKFESAASTFLS
jgi:hypothetical protein